MKVPQKFYCLSLFKNSVLAAGGQLLRLLLSTPCMAAVRPRLVLAMVLGERKPSRAASSFTELNGSERGETRSISRIPYLQYRYQRNPKNEEEHKEEKSWKRKKEQEDDYEK